MDTSKVPLGEPSGPFLMALHTTADRYAVVVSKAGMNVFTRLLSTADDGQLVIEQYRSSIMVGQAAGNASSFPRASRP